MANRYLNLFKLPERLYEKGSPIIIEAGALHKDSVLGDVVAQLKFRSIVPQNITSVTVDITCFNAAKEIITPSFIYKYENIIVNENEQFFGSKTLITLPNNDTRSFSVKITNVEFSDGSTVIITENQWDSIPKQNDLSSFDNVFVEYFRKKYGNTANVLPTEYNDLWLCTCGQENKKDEMVCKRCGITYSEVFPFDIEQEKKNAIYEFAKEKMNSCLYGEAVELFEAIAGWKDADEKIYTCQKKIEEIKAKAEADRLEKERQAETARKEAERIAKRNKKIAIITTPIVCAIIAFIIVLDTVIIPTYKYNNAIELIDTGNIIEAYDALIALDGYKDSMDKANSIYGKYIVEKLKYAKCGDYVLFGSYEQDNNVSNGKEEIEWCVLEINENKLLLISRYAIDCKPYNTTLTDVTWETCSLRKWLNNDFLNEAFTNEDKKIISTETVSADTNPKYNVNPGNATKDQVFLLSVPEAEKYLTSKNCYPTAYAIAKGAASYTNGGVWWLRSPGRYQDGASYVNDIGKITTGFFEHNITEDNIAVRPALWIDLNFKG